MEIGRVKLVRQKLLMKKPVYAQLSDITDSEKSMVTKICYFLSFFATLSLKIMFISMPTYILFKPCNTFQSRHWGGCDIFGFP